MAAQEFFFAIAVSSSVSRNLLHDLAAQVLDRFGCSGDGVAGLVDALQSAVDRGSRAVSAPCDVQFRARDGRLDIVVSSRAGEMWRTSSDIPCSIVDAPVQHADTE